MDKLRLSVADWCFWKDGFEAYDYYSQLRDMGIEAVEMASEARWPAARKAGLKLLNAAGPGMTLGLNRPEHHEKLLAELADLITLAGDNRVSQVVVFSGNRAGLSDFEGKLNCSEALKELAPLASKAGVTLIFEMLGTKDHPDYQADRSAFGFDVARQVNSPAVKVLYDIYHMFLMGEDACADITGNLDIVGHIHVADSRRRSRPVPGGNIDYKPIVSEVHKAGYRGYWGLEFVPRDKPLDEVRKAVDLFRSFI